MISGNVLDKRYKNEVAMHPMLSSAHLLNKVNSIRGIVGRLLSKLGDPGPNLARTCPNILMSFQIKTLKSRVPLITYQLYGR